MNPSARQRAVAHANFPLEADAKLRTLFETTKFFFNYFAR